MHDGPHRHEPPRHRERRRRSRCSSRTGAWRTPRIVGRDPDTDLAVLRIDLKNLPVAPIGRSDRLQVGDVVLAIGSPIGLSQTVTHGIVSATGRAQLGVATFEDFIQTDAAINVGNSGGALIDTSGALVGINTAIIAKNLGVEGIGFAIPVDLVRGVLADIIAHGRVIRGWIGIVPQDVPEYQREQLGLPANGVLIANLYSEQSRAEGRRAAWRRAHGHRRHAGAQRAGSDRARRLAPEAGRDHEAATHAQAGEVACERARTPGDRTAQRTLRGNDENGFSRSHLSNPAWP